MYVFSTLIQTLFATMFCILLITVDNEVTYLVYKIFQYNLQQLNCFTGNTYERHVLLRGTVKQTVCSNYLSCKTSVSYYRSLTCDVPGVPMSCVETSRLSNWVGWEKLTPGLMLSEWLYDLSADSTHSSVELTGSGCDKVILYTIHISFTSLTHLGSLEYRLLCNAQKESEQKSSADQLIRSDSDNTHILTAV